VRAPSPPAASLPEWAGNPIDAFVLARLEREGLTPSPEAGRAALIRRLSFDLLGLPPAPQEVEAFIADREPGAYEKVVDRLLASPRHGERWARHWLDCARYTESQGFEYDRLRPNAWHYRDYVIRAFNEDRPYDRFVAEQLAGDVLDPVTPDGIVATSFLVCGPWDEAGSGQANLTQRLLTREEELEDLVATVAQTFFGITANCARCHDHKYDPIPQVDYYRIKAVFEGVRHGERPLATTAASAGGAPAGGAAVAVTYAGKREEPAPTRRFVQGNVRQPAEEVAPGALSAIVEPHGDFGLTPSTPEAERRRRFAVWAADPRHPLTARVLVNRVWHYHFGRGIVSTTNDFGQSGEPPSHPELLDWLAARFVERGFGIKDVHRLIVTSAAYRQASDFRTAAAALDAENRLLWRFSPRRLEGECVRDAMLAVSGRLDSRLGGPSFQPFTTSTFGSTFYTLVDRDEPDFNRRTVYRMHVNSGKDPLLDALDCPDPSVRTPERRATTTPIQALSLMNGSFANRQARCFAERMARQARGELGEAVALAFRHAFGRGPSRLELEESLATAREHGIETVCWALLNASEFLYVR
jgi:hypothetical protein